MLFSILLVSTVVADGTITVSTFASETRTNTTSTNNPSQLYLSNPLSINNTGLVFYASFNENSTTTIEETIWGDNATINGVNSKWTQSGKFGGAMTYAGFTGNQSSGTTTHLNVTNGFTISMWVYPQADTNNNARRLFQLPHQFELVSWDASGKYYIQAWNQTGTAKNSVSATTAVPQTWQHITGSFNTTHLTVYVNGVLEGTPTAVPGGLRTNGTAYAIAGRALITLNNVWNGSIDEIRIWNRSLSNQEVANVTNDKYATTGYYSTNLTLNGSQPKNFSCAASTPTNTSILATLTTDLSSNFTTCTCPATDCDVSSLANTSVLYINFSLFANTTLLATPLLTSFGVDYVNMTAQPPPAGPSIGLNLSVPTDSGNITSYSILGNHSLNITIGGSYWYVNVTGIQSYLNITITNPGSTVWANAYQLLLPGWSCDGITWNRDGEAAFGNSLYTYKNNISCANALFALAYPYPSQKSYDLYDELADGVIAKQSVIGTTAMGREVRVINVTDNTVSNVNKVVVYVIAGQHANIESFGMHVTEGLLRFITDSSNTSAITIRQNFIYYVVQMSGPDNVAGGYQSTNSNGEDLNRDWNSTDSEEVNAIRTHMNLINSTFGIDFFFDIHSLGDNTTTNQINTFTAAVLGSARYAENLRVIGNLSKYMLSNTKVENAGANNTARGYAWYNLTILGYSLEPARHNNTWTLPLALLEGKGIALGLLDYISIPITVTLANYSNVTACSDAVSVDMVPCAIPVSTASSCDNLSATVSSNEGFVGVASVGTYWSPYDCAILFNVSSAASYAVQTSDGTLVGVQVLEDKTMLAAIIVLPMILSFVLLVGAATLGKEHDVLRIFLFLLSVVPFFASMHLGLLTAIKYYNFVELQEWIGTTTYWVTVLFGVVVTYFIIYTFVTAVHVAAQTKKARLEY